jgi:hypothetical protein
MIAIRITASQTSDFHNLVRVQRNDAGDLVVTWHPDIICDPDAIVAILRALADAAESLAAPNSDTNNMQDALFCRLLASSTRN